MTNRDADETLPGDDTPLPGSRNLLDIVEALCDLPPEEQRQRLDALRLGAAKRRQLESWLGARTGASQFLQSAPPAVKRAMQGLQSPGSGELAGLELTIASAPSPADDGGDRPRLDGFDIIGRLGEGGMGVVWKAIQLSTRRPVALKMMSAASFGSERARLRFEREVELTARLDHPNIARVFDSGLRQGVFYYALELIDGASPLDQHVRERGLTRGQVIALFVTVCRAVQHAHQKGVIHRDLKPANILVGPDGQPHVLDFGLAKALEGGEQLSLDGEVAGTPIYMSPEQAAGRLDQLDTRSDVYTLGVILFYLLCGSFPHEPKGSAIEVMRRIAEQEPRRLKDIEPKADRELQALLTKALAREPERRYGTAGGLAGDLDRYLRGEPLEAQPPTTVYFLKKKLRKYRVSVATATLVCSLLLSTAVWAYVRVTKEKNSALAANVEKEKQRQIAETQRQEAQAQKAQADAAREDAIKQRKVAEEQRRTAELNEANSLIAQANALCLANRWGEAKEIYDQAYAAYQKLQVSTLPADVGMAKANAMSSPALLTINGSGKRIWAIAACPDGQTAISGGDDNNLTLWDLKTGRPLLAFSGHTGSITSIDVSSDGHFVASGSSDKTVRLWDLRSGKQLWVFSGHASRVKAVRFSPDDRAVLSGGDDKVLRLCERSTGAEIKSFGLNPKAILCIGFSADGRNVLTGGADSHTRLWRVDDGKLLREMPGPGSVTAVAFCSVGKQAISGHDSGTCILWDLNLGQEIRRFAGHKQGITGVGLLPNGATFVSASRDQTIKLWNIASGQEMRRLAGHTDELEAIAVLPNGHSTVSCGLDSTVRLWNIENDTEIRSFGSGTGRLFSTGMSSDDRLVVVAHQSLELRDITTGKRIRSIDASNGPTSCAAFSPDNSFALAARGNRLLRWDLNTGRRVQFKEGHELAITAVAISPDGRTALTGSADNTAKVWDLANGRVTRTLTGHRDRVGTVAFSPNGRLAASGSDNADRTVKLWDVRDWSEVRSLAGHAGSVNCLAFLPSSEQLLVGYSQGIRPWDLASDLPARQFGGHSAGALSVASSPEGRFAWSGCEDNSMKFWDVATGRELNSVEHASQVASITTGGSGTNLLCGLYDGSVEFWDWTRPARYREFRSSVPGAQGILRRDEHDAASLAVLGQWYAFRGIDDWAVQLLENARAGGADVSPLLLARCYWKLNDTAAAAREFLNAAERHEAPRQYIDLCLLGVRTQAWEDELGPLVREGKTNEAIRVCDNALAVDPDGIEFRTTRAGLLVHAGRFQEAADDLEGADRYDENYMHLYRAAALREFLGQREEFQRDGQLLFGGFSGPSAAPGVAQITAKICLLDPVLFEDINSIQSLCDRAVSFNDEPLPWGQMTKGLAEYRAGHFEAAMAWLNKCRGAMPGDGNLTDEFLLAMAQYRLGKITEAKQALGAAMETFNATIPATPDGIKDPASWFILQVFRREAEETITGRRLPKPATQPATGTSPG